MNRIVRSLGLVIALMSVCGSASVLCGPGDANGGVLGQEAKTEAVAAPRISRAPLQVRKFRTAQDVVLQSGSLQSAPGRFPDTVIQASGLAASSAQKMSGRVWVMAMRDGMAPDDHAKAGFVSPALSFGGTAPVPGVTATAEIVVRKVEIGWESPALIVFSIGVYRNGELVSSGRAMIDRPGTYPATSTPVDLAPGATYHVEASLSVVTRDATGSRAMVSDAEIRDIRWSF